MDTELIITVMSAFNTYVHLIGKPKHTAVNKLDEKF